MTLPPGQRAISGFPRFGTHLHHPGPAVPPDPIIEVTGPVIEAVTLPLAQVAALPRREVTADLHCVAGWSATNLRWEGVAFETFYRAVIEPRLEQSGPVTHVVFAGLDDYRAVVTIEDALNDDVLLADRLDGQPLDSDHGTPIRLISPSQYGFLSTKHLCRIELHTARPNTDESLVNRLLESHPRARVWQEERHGHLPAWTVRPIYRLLIRPLAYLCARGSRDTDAP